MGELSQSKFNRDIIPETFVLIGGNTPINIENSIVSNYKINNKIEKIFHYYELSGKAHEVGLVFGVYGAPMAIDLIHYLKDGGCKKIIFIGYAYSRNTNWINKLVIVKEALSVDGISGSESNPTRYSPKPETFDEVRNIFLDSGFDLTEDNVSSGPSIFYKSEKTRFLMHEYTHLIEMEVSSIFFASNLLSIDSSALLLVNETKKLLIHQSSGTKENYLQPVVMSLIEFYTSK